MNETDKLNGYIKTAWHELKNAAKNEDWLETQKVFRKMAGLQELHEQSCNLQERIAGLSDETSSNGRAFVHHSSFASAPHFDSQRRGTVRPQHLRIGNDQIPITINNQIVIATANWIIRKGKTLPRIHNFVHATSAGFAPSAQIKQLEDGSFIEIGDSQNTLVQKARKLLNAAGFRELTIEVLLEDGTLKTG